MSKLVRWVSRVVVITAVAVSACARPTDSTPRSPDHLLVMVFDQMRPDYIDRFDLQHFKRLRATSRHYPQAYVGHLAAQTVVSHLVINTGLPPKELPWQDDVFVDNDGLLGRVDAVYKTDDLTREQFWRLLESVPRQRFLSAAIRDAFGGSVFAVGEKDYATEVFGGPHATGIVTLAKAAGKCTPDGVNVPDYIARNPRFSLECAETYGTNFPTIYSLDGSHYVPGSDRSRSGGDMWTTDVALEIMQREQWSALLLTFGAIDRVAHMLGEQDGAGLVSVASQYRLADVLRIADAQLGRILDGLDKRGLANRTMVVVTADHGGQRNDSYLGNNRFQSCCPYDNVADTPVPPYWVEHLSQVGRLRTAYVDSSVDLWLADHSRENEEALIRGLRDVSGMTDIFAKRSRDGRHTYERVYSTVDLQAPGFRRWASQHNAELVATMAAAGSPDLVGLLADGFGFGRIGGHGGAQEKVQRIPMIIRVPGEVPSTRTTPLRLMDVAPEIRGVLRLDRGQTRPTDATSTSLIR